MEIDCNKTKKNVDKHARDSMLLTNDLCSTDTDTRTLRHT